MLVLISALSGQSCSPWKPVLQDVPHGFHKRVDLFEGSVDVRRYPQAVVAQVGLFGIVVADGGDHNAVFIPKMRNELVGIHTIDRNDGQSPGLAGFEAGMQPDPLLLLELVRPAQRQVTQARGFALDTAGWRDW